MVGTTGLLVAYVFLSGQYEKQLWLALALVACLPTLAAAATQASRREELEVRTVSLAAPG